MQNNLKSSSLDIATFGQLTWASCNKIKHKAMQQEFSWSGFIVSLSIAFFVVVSSSYSISIFVSRNF